jgi:DNA-binding PadR family transcriptional regulator
MHRKKQTPQPSTESKIQKDTLRDILHIHILQLLHEKPSYVYEIIRDTRKKYNLTIPIISYYSILRTFEKQKYVTAKHAIKNSRGIKIYTLTETGHTTLQEAMKIIKTLTQENK